MKRKFFILFLLLIPFSLLAQEIPEPQQEETSDISIVKESNPFLDFFINPWYTISFNEGASYAQITRIEIIKNRSNFVRETFLAGAFVNAKTDNLSFIDLVIQLGAYYPFYNAFNGMEQFPKNTILYAFDSYFGAVYSFDALKYILIDISLGMHFMYQLTDEYHMCYLGLGTLNTIEFPVTKNWTIVNNYFFSYDNANLGSNKNVQKFNAAYQYHIDLGFRYSRKSPNPYYYFDIQKMSKEKQAEVVY